MDDKLQQQIIDQQQMKQQACGLDYEHEYMKNREEIVTLRLENEKLKQALLKIALKL